MHLETNKNAPRGCAETHMVNYHFVTCVSRQSGASPSGQRDLGR